MSHLEEEKKDFSTMSVNLPSNLGERENTGLSSLWSVISGAIEVGIVGVGCGVDLHETKIKILLTWHLYSP